MNAREVAEVLCLEVPGGPLMLRGMAAADYAAVIVDRVESAVHTRVRVRADVVLELRGLIAAGGVFDAQQKTLLHGYLRSLLLKPKPT